MANRTDLAEKSIRGINPQNLVEKILQTKIYESSYWKEQCFGLSAVTPVDKAMELDHVGGTFGGNRKPTPFMCLVVKMLQIQPEKEIVIEFIENKNFKYVRVLGAFYLRLTGTESDVYGYLEPLYKDFRKLRRRLGDGRFVLTHVDEFVDELWMKDYSCDIVLPYIKKRWSFGSLDRQSALNEDEFDLQEEEEKPEYTTISPREMIDYHGCKRRRAKVPEENGNTFDDEPKGKKAMKEDGYGADLNHEIAEANRIRASLGLKPLML